MKSETREELANYLLNHCFVIGNLDSTREKYYLITNNEEELQTIFYCHQPYIAGGAAG